MVFGAVTVTSPVYNPRARAEVANTIETVGQEPLKIVHGFGALIDTLIQVTFADTDGVIVPSPALNASTDWVAAFCPWATLIGPTVVESSRNLGEAPATAAIRINRQTTDNQALHL